jgi:hypothetical protein
MLGVGVEVAGQLTDVLAPIGEEGDLLVGLHPVGGKHVKQATFGFLVIGLHVAEAGRLPRGGHGLSGDHFEPAIAAAPLHRGVDLAAVQADDQWQVRAGQLRPLAWTPRDDTGVLVTELVLQTLPGGLHLQPKRGGVQRSAEWEQLAQQRDGDPRRRPARSSAPAGRTAPGWSAPGVSRPRG